jgi:hypothetical protein
VQLFWFLIAPIVILVAAFTLIDVFKYHRGGWATAGWVVLVVVLPLVGSVIYWVTRRATPPEVEAAYLADRELRR